MTIKKNSGTNSCSLFSFDSPGKITATHALMQLNRTNGIIHNDIICKSDMFDGVEVAQGDSLTQFVVKKREK